MPNDRGLPSQPDNSLLPIIYIIGAVLVVASIYLIYTKTTDKIDRESVIQKDTIEFAAAEAIKNPLPEPVLEEAFVENELKEKPIGLASGQKTSCTNPRGCFESDSTEYQDDELNIRLDPSSPGPKNIGELAKLLEAQQRMLDEKLAEFEKQNAADKLALLNAPLQSSNKVPDSGSGNQYADSTQLLHQEMQQLASLEQSFLSGMQGGIGAQPSHRNDNTAFAEELANRSVAATSAMPTGNPKLMIHQGKLLDATLESAIDSTLPGDVRATLARPVYADAGRKVLIPRNARLIGSYNSNVLDGQDRVFIVWTRAIWQKNGRSYDITLNSNGTDTLGRAGVEGIVDRQFWSRFGSAALISIIGATTSNIGSSTAPGGTGDLYQAALGQSFGDVAKATLANSSHIGSRIYKDQGEPVQIFVARDLNFSTVH